MTKNKLMPFRISESMIAAFKDKLQGTFFTPSAAIRAAIAQMINMERKDMMLFISRGLGAVDTDSGSANNVDTPKE